MDWKVCGSFTLLLFLYFVPESKAWSGGCSAWRSSWVPHYYYENYCCPGWTHNGNQVCTIPICYPTCKNGGTCINPNVCDCHSAYIGATCETIIFDDEKPQLLRVLATFATLKRIPDIVKYEFVADATNKNETEMIWCNQNQFNILTLQLDSIYMNPNGFPANRQIYVYDYGIGIVGASIHVNLTKIPRNDGAIRDVHLDQTYNCHGLHYMKPKLNTAAKCHIKIYHFSMAFSNGDWLTVTFQAENGGFRTRTDRGTRFRPDIVMGRIDRKIVEIRFGFEAAIHCSERNGTCPEKPLAIAKDITSLFPYLNCFIVMVSYDSDKMK